MRHFCFTRTCFNGLKTSIFAMFLVVGSCSLFSCWFFFSLFILPLGTAFRANERTIEKKKNTCTVAMKLIRSRSNNEICVNRRGPGGIIERNSLDATIAWIFQVEPKKNKKQKLEANPTFFQKKAEFQPAIRGSQLQN